MVFASYNSASYLLPLDNDQSVAFYRNENRLFPTPIGPAPGGVAPPPGRNSGSNAANDMSITDMLTAAYHHEMQQQHHQTVGSGAGGGGGGGASVGNIATGDCPFGRVQSPAAQQQQPYHHRFGGSVAMCDDFQPVGYLNGSSNGYYGFVPSLAAPTGGSGGGSGGGGVGGARGPEPCNNNNVLPDAVNNNRSQHRPVTAANVNGHLSAMHFHGNRNHISCSDAGEQNNNNNSNNNNNNNNGDAAGMFHVQPFPAQQLLVRKRKEAANQQHQQHEDEEMDTNGQLAAGQQHPKRRKTSDTEQGWMEAVPFPGSNGGGVLYQHRAEIHEPAMDEMECQDPHLPAAVNGLQGATATGQQHQLPTSKSKYFDTSRCMMSHMI